MKYIWLIIVLVVVGALGGWLVYQYSLPHTLVNGVWQEHQIGQEGGSIGRRITVEADMDDQYLIHQGLHFVTSTLSVVSFSAHDKTVAPDFALVEAGRVRMVFSDTAWLTSLTDTKPFFGSVTFKDHDGKQAIATGKFKRAEPDTSGLAPKK